MLNYTTLGIVLTWSSEPGQVCGHIALEAAVLEQHPLQAWVGSVSKVFENLRAVKTLVACSMKINTLLSMQ